MNTRITPDQRSINILNRAINDTSFKLSYDMLLSVNVFAAAETLIDEIDYDRIDIAETNTKYSHLSRSDGHGFEYSTDGQFISGNREKREYYHRLEDGTWQETKLYDHNPGDIIYVRMQDVIDSDAQVVALVAKYEV